MNIFNKIFFFIFLFLINNLNSQSISSFISDELKGKIDYFIERSLIEAEIPGGVVVITEYDRVVHIKGFGYSNFKQKSLFTPQTVFNLGTLSRHFTILGILQLQDKNLISLGNSINHYLPSLNIGRDGLEKTITVKHLIYSMGGFSISDEKIARLSNGNFPVYKKDYLNSLAELNIYDKPTNFYKENNIGYLILSEIISTLSNQAFENSIKNNIIKPLGMKNTHYSIYDAKKQGMYSYGYLWGKIKLVSPEEISKVYNPTLRMFSNGEDLSKYLLLHTSNQNPILQKSTVRDMQFFKARLDNSSIETYGMGFFKKDFMGEEILYYDTYGLGSSGSIYLIPKKNIAIAFYTNLSSYPATWQISDGLVSLIYGIEPFIVNPIKTEKNLGLFGLFLMIISFLFSVFNSFFIQKVFSKKYINYIGEESLSFKFILSLSVFLVLIWLRFLFIPSTDFLGKFTNLQNETSPNGWNIELYFGITSILFTTFLFVFYFSVLMIKSSKNRSR
jgi:putative pyoverdin transport system ATP-binding/permease protein